MNLPRLWRTVRHLSAEQWVFRAVCRGQRVLMNAMPSATRRRIERAAMALDVPDIYSPRMIAVAGPVLALQQAVHGENPSGAYEGRFSLLNEDFDFGSVEAVSWRGEFNEGNNPLRRMNLAYMGYLVPLLASGEARALDLAVTMLRGMEEQNPWSIRGVFRDVWNAYTASHRLINLLSGLALYRQAGGKADEKAEADIINHARLCAAFIRANLERDLQYNHLLKNYVALSVWCAGLETPPGNFRFLNRAVPKSLRQNILPDGGHAERCPMYHALGLLDLKMLAECGVFTGDVQADIEATREKMASALPVMTHPDGDVALFNDSWIGEAPQAASLVDMRQVGNTETLPLAGYTRIGDGGDAIILDCGPCGPDDNPGHAHADFLSVEMSIGGQRFLVDPGIPTYTAGALRDISRSASSHNGPHLAGAEPIEFWKSFRVGRRGYAWPMTGESLGGFAPLWAAGRQDGYQHLGVEVRRWAGLWPGRGALICDLWLGQTSLDAASHFLVPADWKMTGGENPRFERGAAAVTFSALVGEVKEVSPDRHWVRFGVEEAAHRTVLVPQLHDTNPKRRQAALFLGWSDDAMPPDAETLSALFDRLAD